MTRIWASAGGIWASAGGIWASAGGIWASALLRDISYKASLKFPFDIPLNNIYKSQFGVYTYGNMYLSP